MQAQLHTADNIHHITLMGIDIAVRAGGADTDGAVTVLEQQVAPGAGSPPHAIGQDKLLLVLDGAVEVLMGETRRRAGRGDVAFLPRGVVHCFTNRGATPARILVVTTPGGHEAMLGDLAAAARAQAAPPALAEVAARHGARLVL